MAGGTAPFAAFEWMVAWRYLRAKRREGGVSVMTWISLIGIALAVFALVATLAVRTGFRIEFTDRILGANAHVTLQRLEGGRIAALPDFDALAAAARALPGVTRAVPVIRGQVMASANGRNTGVDLHGMRAEDVAGIPLVARPEWARGNLARLDEGVAIGEGIARELGLTVGDRITLISPDGPYTPMGRSLRVSVYEVVYIFRVGRYDIDRTRVYLPLAEAQTFFNLDGAASHIEVMVAAPDALGTERARDPLTARLAALAPGLLPWTWKDASGAFLEALDLEDNVMFVVMSILVLVASLNITSGLVMLVKNKGRDVAVLRTMGFSTGSVLRIFFLCGALIGIAGTVAGVILGAAFAVWIDPIFAFFTGLLGGGWDPARWSLTALPAKLVPWDVARAVMLSLALSFVVTIFPARRAARLNPVEALRYE